MKPCSGNRDNDLFAMIGIYSLRNHIINLRHASDSDGAAVLLEIPRNIYHCHQLDLMDLSTPVLIGELLLCM